MAETILSLVSQEELEAIYKLIVGGFNYIRQLGEFSPEIDTIDYEPAEESSSDKKNIP